LIHNSNISICFMWKILISVSQTPISCIYLPNSPGTGQHLHLWWLWIEHISTNSVYSVLNTSRTILFDFSQMHLIDNVANFYIIFSFGIGPCNRIVQYTWEMRQIPKCWKFALVLYQLKIFPFMHPDQCNEHIVRYPSSV
jgi:uncharacterized membrane protein